MAVPITFTCSCGEKLEVPAGTVGRMAYCLKCRKSVPIPDAAGSAAGPSVTNAVARATRTDDGGVAARGGGASGTYAQARGEEAQCVLVHGEDGKDYWKVICSCGKHVRTPVAVGRPYGRCPKCGQLLKMPGYVHPQETVQPPARPGAGPGQAALAGGYAASGGAAKSGPKPGEDESETAALGVAPVGERTSRGAALVAADRLRPSHAGAGGAGAEVENRISAWPLAGKSARILAAFIDLTIAVILAGIVVVLARKQVLPMIFLKKEMVVIVLVLALVLNDGLIHLLLGASIGKKFVLITTREAGGKEMGRGRTLLRAFLKWMLFPGWLIGLVDPSGRTLHDLLCNTLVLRGRAKGRRSQKS